ncbi:MAG: UbiA family prenyltransferase [Verrucomicrobiales bacterium]|nr:UbiA family prenyltransferase [Verrucomicrobiales bacterium]
MPAAPISIRTLLVLGRVSNLPTIWSNCLAGWMLGGGGNPGVLIRLCLGASLMYVAGMYLNDAFDAEFDRQHRRTRPIPSGAISVETVWRIGWGLLGVGWVVVAMLGVVPAGLGVLLAVAILIYDATHKALAVSPLLMALCRFLLYLVAASAGRQGITGTAIWGGVALAGWIVGLSYVAKRESTTGRLPRWPLTVLGLPFLFAILMDTGEARLPALLAGVVLALWALWCLRHTFEAGGRNLGLTVAGLLAGICLVDWLAVLPGPGGILVFLGCFGLSLLAQRYVPAT